MPEGDSTQMLAEARRLAKQFLLQEGYDPAQSVVEGEVLPAIEKAQRIHGGGTPDADQGPTTVGNPRVQSRRRSHAPTKSDGGIKKARAAALSNRRATGKYRKSKTKGK